MWNMKGKGTLKEGSVKGRETTDLTEAVTATRRNIQFVTYANTDGVKQTQ